MRDRENERLVNAETSRFSFVQNSALFLFWVTAQIHRYRQRKTATENNRHSRRASYFCKFIWTPAQNRKRGNTDAIRK